MRQIYIREIYLNYKLRLQIDRTLSDLQFTHNINSVKFYHLGLLKVNDEILINFEPKKSLIIKPIII